MIRHPSISVFVMAESTDATLSSLLSYLKSMPHIRLSAHPHLPPDFDSEVTNTDQERNQIRFSSCKEEDFIHSDIVVAILEAAARSMANGETLEVMHGGS